MDTIRCQQCESLDVEYTDDNLDELFETEEFPSQFTYRRFYMCNDCENEFSENHIFEISFSGYEDL